MTRDVPEPHHDRRLVLASGSQARLRVLRLAGIHPEVVVSGVDESTGGLETRAAVAVLAERKASEVANRRHGSLVLGCDSLLDLEGTALGKPGSPAEATEMWALMSGRQATLFTGHCLIDGSGKLLTEVGGTLIRFGSPTTEEVAAYVNSGEPEGLAGAFSIDGLGAPFVDGIDGDASNVLGLSLPLLRRMLATFGIRIFDLWRDPFSFEVRELGDDDRQWLRELVETEWGLPVVSVSGAHDPGQFPGFVAERHGERLGALTYRQDANGVEVVTLNSLIEGRGIGSKLLAEAHRVARATGRRLWLVTTNENLEAIGFYQRRGMDMVALHRDFVEEVRRSKPDLESTPAHGIEFRHAIEFEYPAAKSGARRSLR